MFDNSIFESWLDEKSRELVSKIANQEPLTSEEMIILVLKAQSNHFHHLDEDLRKEMRELRDDMDKRFEQVDKRFEQVDKRFEQVDKRFDAMISRMDRFMIWSLGLTMTSTVFIITMMYKMVG